ncbi:MFS transporter [Micromonospora aurantiaca]|uniref:MFS transporter n=1 Tax=Micromonospora aurantiaca (nom. illeg.) TaxID=47850 RepID=A0ABQ6UBY5_9ACTN|nr:MULTISPECIES: MFS transporter [Micromonospora]KAB1107691.1 MFS transporter [Micromonospora aurantiaca]MBC8989944.1 MFS transporter [Micromonospora chalcea]MCT2280711.1 MFS transporter [Micromonospora chalcea]MDG4752693.1 MFS transporter [Micromonospora sp. WMMD718]RNH97638.1 MFS transporter [Micromonospora aurantiaca]
MTTTTMAPADPTVGGHHRWRIVAALAITSTVGYGTIYYAYAVLLGPMATSLGASITAVTGALTVSVLAGALMAIAVGRWLDRHGGRALMTLGSITATALLIAWSQVQTIGQLYAVMIGVGITGAMVLYEPAFAVIVSWFTPDRRPTALLAVTVVAGFASTIFMPLTGYLVAHLGWRGALLTLAAVHGVVTVPLHALTVRKPPHVTASNPTLRTAHASRRTAARAAMRDPRFWILAAALIAHGAATSTIGVHLVSYLTSRGHPATYAATAAGLLGVLSVTGRLVLTAARRRLPVTTIVAGVFAIQAVAVLAMPLAAGTRVGAIVTVTGFGLGFGIASLATPALLVDRYGTTAYATIAGRLAAPVTTAKAAAPLLAATLLPHGGYHLLLAAVSTACLLAAISMRTVGEARTDSGEYRNQPDLPRPGTRVAAVPGPDSAQAPADGERAEGRHNDSPTSTPGPTRST